MSTESTPDNLSKTVPVCRVVDLFRQNSLVHADDPYLQAHNLVYASVLEQFEPKAVNFIREPTAERHPIIRLEGGRVLRFETLGEEFGHRPFDCPILETGGPFPATISPDEFSPPVIHYYIQPEIEIATEPNLVFEFTRKIKAAGWKDVDLGYAGQGQVGWYEIEKLGADWVKRAEESGVLVTDDKGRALVLIDYESIQENSEKF